LPLSPHTSDAITIRPTLLDRMWGFRRTIHAARGPSAAARGAPARGRTPSSACPASPPRPVRAVRSPVRACPLPPAVSQTCVQLPTLREGVCRGR
jgi:hypothetical protein